MNQLGRARAVAAALLTAGAAFVSGGEVQAQVPGLSFETMEEVNPIGRIWGVPQPISIDELRRLLECDALDADAQGRLLDAIAEYRRSAAAIRDRELMPAKVLEQSDSSRAEEARAALARGLERRAVLDRRLFAELRALTLEAECLERLDEVRSAIERRTLRERIGAPKMLGYGIEIGPIVRGALARPRTLATPVRGGSTDAAARSDPLAHGDDDPVTAEQLGDLEALLRRSDARHLELLTTLEASTKGFSARFRAELDARGVKAPDPSTPHDAEANQRYSDERDAVARDVSAASREAAMAIAAHLRATVEALRPVMQPKAWRRMRDQFYTRVYGGPFVRTGGSPVACLLAGRKQLLRSDPPNEAAIGALDAIADTWRRDRDALETQLADAIDGVRADGAEDDKAELLKAAVAPIVERIEALDESLRPQLVALGVDCPNAQRSGWQPMAFGIRRPHDSADSVPPPPAQRGFLMHGWGRESEPRAGERGEIAPLDAPWLDRILDGAQAAETQRTVAHALLRDSRARLELFFDLNRERLRIWDEGTRVDMKQAQQDLERGEPVRETLHAEIAREEAVLFEQLQALLGDEAVNGWTSLRFELADRDRRRLGRRSRMGGSTTDLAPSSEPSIDLVRLIDDEPSLAFLRSSDDSSTQAPVLDLLREYGRQMSGAIDRHVRSTATQAQEARAGRPPSSDEFRESHLDLGRLNRSFLQQLESILDNANDRAALRRAYRRAAWPAVFDRVRVTRLQPMTVPAQPPPLPPELSERAIADLDRIDNSLFELLMHERPVVLGMSAFAVLEEFWRLDGLRWERSEILADAEMRRAKERSRATTPGADSESSSDATSRATPSVTNAAPAQTRPAGQ